MESIIEAVGLTMRDLFCDHKQIGRAIAATYPYQDQSGRLLYEVVRYEPKDFRQRRPGGPDGWIWNLNGIRRAPYRLPHLKGRACVFIVEGEKDADRLWRCGIAATTNAGGAGKWTSELTRQLVEAGVTAVVVIADNDEQGERHADAVAALCHGQGIAAKRLNLPGLPAHGDVSDFLVNHTQEQLLTLADKAPAFKSSQRTPAKERHRAPDNDERADSAATGILKRFDRLIDKGLAELFHCPKGDAYVSLVTDGRRETYALKSRAFRQWLARRYYRDEGKVCGSEALRSAIEALTGQAVHDGVERRVAVRVAESDGVIYIDLGDSTWRCVAVSKDRWQIVSDPPVRFRRPPNLRALPEPIPGGSLADLFEFLNVPDERHRILLLAWLIAAAWPKGPYPILVLHGGQGSAKSTLAEFVKQLIDPSEPLLRSAPRDERDLVIAVSNSQVVTLDNLSSVHSWLSDALCRISTGGGVATRVLYSDDEEAVFDVQCPVILNGIEELASRPDLLDRSVILAMPPIAQSERRDEAGLKARFERARPALLGALLSVMSATLANLDGTEIPFLPRMADFARLAVAAEPALGRAPGSFIAAYMGNIAEANDTALESSAVATAVLDLLKPGGEWDGSAKELLAELWKLVSEDVRREKHWPKTARGLSNALKRVESNLAAVGVSVERIREGHDRKRVLYLRRNPLQSSASSAATANESGRAEDAADHADERTEESLRTSADGHDDLPDFSGFADEADGADDSLPDGD